MTSAVDSGFQNHCGSGFQFLDSGYPTAKISWIPDSGFSYMGRNYSLVITKYLRSVTFIATALCQSFISLFITSLHCPIYHVYHKYKSNRQNLKIISIAAVALDHRRHGQWWFWNSNCHEKSTVGKCVRLSNYKLKQTLTL